MPGTKTIDEFEADLGIPIVLLTGYNHATKQMVYLRLRDLPLGAIIVVLAWLNNNLP